MNKNKSNNTFKKFCEGIGSHCGNGWCTFAHNIDEIRINPCNNGVNCNNKICKYIHPGENNLSYFIRLKPRVPLYIEEEIEEIMRKSSNTFYNYQ
jgi:hypothetical protein